MLLGHNHNKENFPTETAMRTDYSRESLDVAKNLYNF